ncbi:MAG: GCN5-related N-acetyltransferase [Jatrophihabitantaceae bacterium]|nr:GCN5-related N-acetyltransferase [Jatrophihabitantaceae bacterium]
MSALSVEVWSGAQLRERMPEAMAVYAQAMGYAPSVADQRGGFAASHSRYPDFECRVSLDGNAVVGIAYGYGSRAGQWWHDAVRRALSAEIARAWLVDAFELSELHVLPSYQGRRLGRLMLESLVAPIPHAAVLLSTPEGPTRAFSLYRNLGFVDLARHHLFAGDSRPFAVLGAQLPLAASPSDASRAGASQPDERGAGRA